MFGAAYYNEYMPYNRIDTDLRLMKEAGMNTIRIAESTWSTEEPSDGVFDFSYVDAVLDAAEKHSINVIIGTPTYAVPSWLVKKFPEIMVTNKDGQVKYGPRQSMDIFNPDFLRYAERIVRKLAEHTAGRKCVIGFQLDNETKHYDNYGKYAQEKFVEYLKQKYNSPENFSRAFTLAYWSNSISSWDDMPDISNTINHNLRLEYLHFLRQSAGDYLIWQRKIIEEYKRPDQFVTHNFDYEWRGYSHGVQPGIYHKHACDAVTVAGCDIYHPSQFSLTGKEIAFGGDLMRSLKRTNYLVLETEAQGFKEWTPFPGQLRLQAFSHLANGANGLMYWNWHSIHNSFETYWKGVLGHDLMPGAIYGEAKKIGNEFSKLCDTIINLEKSNSVAIVVDNDSLSALDYFPMDKDFNYNDVVRWVYDTLYEMNVECDIIDVNAISDSTQQGKLLSKYKLVITPALYCISEENTAAFKKYVEDGGTLFSTFRSFYSDTKGTVWPDSHPYNLTEVFGASYTLITQAEGVSICGEKAEHYVELIEPLSEENALSYYEHKYWSRYAAVTKNKYKKGTAYYFGAYTSKNALRKFLFDALSSAGIQTPEFSFPIIMRSGKNQKGQALHYVFNYSSKKANFTVPFENARELISGKDAPKGTNFSINDWDFLLFLETVI